MGAWQDLFKRFWIWLGGGAPAVHHKPSPPAVSAPPPPPHRVTPPAPPPPRRVMVRAGDTLFNLAANYNTSVQAIAQANQLTMPYKIYVGQSLLVPQGGPAGPTPPTPPTKPQAYRVRRGETVESIARKFALPPAAIRAENRLATEEALIPGQWLMLPAVSAPETGADFPATLPPIDQARPKRGKSVKPSEQPQPDLESEPARSAPERPPSRPKPRPPLQIVPPARPKPPPAEPESPPAPAEPTRPPRRETERRPAESPPTRPPAHPAEALVPPGEAPPARSQPAPARPAPQIPSPHREPSREQELGQPLEIPKEITQGIYIAYHTLGNRLDRARTRQFVQESAINTVVIDIKNDWGYLSYRSRVPLAADLKANRPLLDDIQRIIGRFKADNVTVIGRLVTFKDNLLARAFPDQAVRRAGAEGIWQDRQGMAWLSPFAQVAWDYNLQLIDEAAALGFDEIMLDSLRFPIFDRTGWPDFGRPLTPAGRLKGIVAFLSAARGLLVTRPVSLSATLLGYTCWRQDDSLIGQHIESLAPYLDILSPLLYPSSFPNGIPGCPHPLDCPAELTYQSTRRAVERLTRHGLTCRVRPWLQDFKDDAFDLRVIDAAQVRSQIVATIRAGGSGYLSWNPQTAYSTAAYRS